MSRAPRAELTDVQWDAIRAAWETGVPNRKLAADYNVDESSIRYRAKKGGWTRDEAAIERIQTQGQVRTLHAVAQPVSRAVPHPAGTAGTPRESGVLTPEERERLREERIESAADVIAQANLRALAKTEHLDGTFDRLRVLLDDLLTTPAEDDDEGRARKARAVQTLLAGRTDSVGGIVLALARLAESIQKQRRLALGADDQPKRVQLSGPGGGPIQTESQATVTATVDYGRYSTAELELLMAAAALIEGRRERPPVPVPPGDPEPPSEGG